MPIYEFVCMTCESRFEELSRLADERDPLLILVEAGRLAHEHQVGVRIPHAEHRLRARPVQLAAHARVDLAREQRQLLAAA